VKREGGRGRGRGLEGREKNSEWRKGTRWMRTKEKEVMKLNGEEYDRKTRMKVMKLKR
jgi:hypothetical protein